MSTYPFSVPSGVPAVFPEGNVTSLGTASSPFMGIYATSLYANSLSIPSGGSIVPATSGVGSIGATGTPFGNIYTSSISATNLTTLNQPSPWITPYSKAMQTYAGPGSMSVYGTWDGNYFWGGNQLLNTIYKISPTGGVVASYSGFASIQQLAWDGRYIWVSSYNSSGTLFKFDPIAGVITGTYSMNPSLNGDEGVQGLMYDGAYLWAGVAQFAGTGSNTGLVLKLSSSGTILQTTTGQTNVNGLTTAVVSGIQYIYAANSGFIGKINASNGTYQSFTTPGTATYRITTDGNYIYGVDFYGFNIVKFNATNGTLVGNYGTTVSGNDIKFDGANLWVVGNPNTAYIHDPANGALLQTIPSGGSASLWYDGIYMWSIDGVNAYVNRMNAGNSINSLKVYNTFGVATSGNMASFYVNESGNATATSHFATSPAYAFATCTGTTSASPAFTTQNKWYPVSGTAANTFFSGNQFTYSTVTQSGITYQGPYALFQVSASLGAATNGLNDVMLFSIIKNSGPPLSMSMSQVASATGEKSSLSTYAITPLISGDVIYPSWTNNTSTNGPIFYDYNVIISKVL